MRAVTLLLVCAGLVRVGAFSSLPDYEQIESRVGKNDYTVVKTGVYCENRDGGVRLGGGFVSVQACADAARANAGCGSGFSFGGSNCDCSPVGETCTISADFAGFTVFLLVEPESPPAPPRSPPSAPPPPAYMVATTGAYCGNRVCSGKSCAQSRTTVDAAACAAAVMKDPKCGNSFSFSYNENEDLQYCDCSPPGEPCVATPFAFYDVYELVYDKTAVYTQQQYDDAKAEAKVGMVTQKKYDAKEADLKAAKKQYDDCKAEAEGMYTKQQYNAAKSCTFCSDPVDPEAPFDHNAYHNCVYTQNEYSTALANEYMRAVVGYNCCGSRSCNCGR